MAAGSQQIAGTHALEILRKYVDASNKRAQMLLGAFRGQSRCFLQPNVLRPVARFLLGFCVSADWCHSIIK